VTERLIQVLFGGRGRVEGVNHPNFKIMFRKDINKNNHDSNSLPPKKLEFFLKTP